MTDKPYVLGRGRLYFGDRLLGEVIPDPEDPVTLMRKRETTFKATVEMKDFAYARWINAMLVMDVTKYNPQLLLSDQRTPEKKRADDLVAAYRKSFPDLVDYWNKMTVVDLFKFDEAAHLRSWYGPGIGETYEPTGEYEKAPPPKWHDGGTITGRFSGRETHWPVMQPRDEFVLPKDHPMVAIDYGKIEARVLSSLQVKTAFHKPITVDVSHFAERLERATRATSRFAQQMELMAVRSREFMSRKMDKQILFALFGHVDIDKPEPQFDRERRIAKLLRSRDPRQNKRGERLFLSWRRNRPGINYNPYRKD